MHRAEDYLDNLEQDRQNLVQALRNNNVEVQDNETMTSLANKVATKVDASLNEVFRNPNRIRYPRDGGQWIFLLKNITVPQIFADWSFESAFKGLKLLEHINSKIVLTTKSNTSGNGFFEDCESLIEIPEIENTHYWESFPSFAENCKSLKTVSYLKLPNVTSVTDAFKGCVNLENIAGFEDLGKAGTITIDLSDSPKLTYQSVLNIINTVYDVSTLDYNCTLTLHANVFSQLTDTDKELANSKGWLVNGK